MHLEISIQDMESEQKKSHLRTRESRERKIKWRKNVAVMEEVGWNLIVFIAHKEFKVHHVRNRNRQQTRNRRGCWHLERHFRGTLLPL